MWQKDNPDRAAAGPSETGVPSKRNTEALAGVKAAAPAGSARPEPAPASPQAPGKAFSITDIDSVAAPAAWPASQGREQGQGASGPASPAPSPAGAPPGGMPPVRAGWTDPASGWARLVDFYGKGGELFWIFLVNLVLTLITLGVYAFWGKTRVRRYLWGKTHVLGQALEYTGTGKELFISFLIVMPILMCGVFAYNYLFYMNIYNVPLAVFLTLLFYGGFILLWQIASYKALRYRLTRTRWRGIRGNLSGSAFSYGIKGTAYLLLTLLTLGIATPWMTSRLVSIQLNNVWFGNRPLAFNGPAKELVKSFFIMLVLFFAIMIVSGIVLYGIMYDANMMHLDGADSSMMRGHAFRAFLVYFLMIVGMMVCTAYYNATFYRWVFGHMNFGKLRTRSRLTGWDVVKLRCTNLLLVIFTLGIGLPWAEIRTKRLYLQSIDHKGDPELNELLQDTRSAPSRGEGLLDALDMDIGF